MIENHLIHQMNETNEHVIDDDPTRIIETKNFVLFTCITFKNLIHISLSVTFNLHLFLYNDNTYRTCFSVSYQLIFTSDILREKKTSEMYRC